MARGRDAIDALCDQWAVVRRELIGLRDPVHSSDYLGAVRSTLGQRRDLHAGSRSAGRVEQHFPEVYLGDALAVNRAFQAMSPTLREIMDWHYTLTHPRAKGLRADLMGVSLRVYWERVNRAKCFVEGALAMNVRT